jgi:hypothetical protein
MDLFFITFYTANTLMKIEYWGKPDSRADLILGSARISALYTGEYWLYTISYPAIMAPGYLLLQRAELRVYG